MNRWRDLARCEGEDTETFFDPTWEHIAKRICSGCLVQDACLTNAVDTDDRHAIRGGLTYDERITLGIQQPPPDRGCGSLAAYKRHKRANEDPCDRCRQAKAAYDRRHDEARRARNRKERVA